MHCGRCTNKRRLALWPKVIGVIAAFPMTPDKADTFDTKATGALAI
jgi:hypothetical protein